MITNEPSTFEILPAIDLADGHVVRLRQGDFRRARSYGDDPAAVAESFVARGASWLHVVDLDGARTGDRQQVEVMARIVERVGGRIGVEVAGGLRTADAIDAALAAGARRVVLGTAALLDPAFAGRAVARHGSERIAAAIDVRDGFAVGEGWRAGAPRHPVKATLDQLLAAGVRTWEVTAIDRDGLLGGPDLALLDSVVRRGDGEVIASGGIRSIADLQAVRQIGCRGAIVGRALYDGALDLRAALDAAAEARPAATGTGAR